MQLSLEGTWRLELDPPIPTDRPEREQAELVLERLRVAEANDVLARRYGFARPEDLVGARVDDLWQADREEKIAALLYIIRCEYRVTDLETTGRYLDGSRGWFLNSITGIVEEGRLLGAWGTYLDITRRKQAEEALRESEARYRRFMQMSVEGIWRADVDPPISTGLPEREQAELILQRTRVAECNESFARFFGESRPEDMVGRSMDDLWEEEHEIKIATIVRMIRADYRGADVETTVQARDGHLLQLLNNVAGVVEEGLLRSVWGTQLDITRRREAEEALRESEELFRTLIEQGMDGVALADLGTMRVTMANPQMCRLLGYREEELTRLHVLDLHPEEARPRVMEVFTAQARGEIKTPVELPVRRKDGTVFEADVSAKPLMVGERGCMLGVFRDITERKRAEESLRASEQRFRAIVESSRDWIWFCDTTGTDRYSNRSVHDLLGYAPEELAGQPIVQFIHPEDVPRVEAAMQRGLAERTGWSRLVIRWRRKDGSFRHLESTSAPAFDSEGVVQGWYGVDRDITDRMRIQEALQHSEARLRALLASMTDVILVLDAQGRILEIAPTNPDPRYHLSEQKIGKTAYDLFPAEQADRFQEAVEVALGRCEEVHIEYSMPIQDGEICFAATISPLSTDTVLLVARDVTAQVEARERALAAERARADLAEHLNEEINHRARNNLAMVSGLLQTQALQEPDPNVASRLREAVARIRTFVDIHEKIYATGAEQVDLLEVIRSVATTLGSIFSATGAEFSVAGESGLFPTWAATNLAVMTNELMTNAMKHGGPDPEGRLPHRSAPGRAERASCASRCGTPGSRSRRTSR